MTDTVFAGVDIGKTRLDVAISAAPRGKLSSFSAPNDTDGVGLIVDRMRRLGVAQVVIESIGVYGARFAHAATMAGLKVSIVDPRRIQALRVMEGGRAKTDKLDARLIARFSRMMSETLRPIPDADAQELRALSTRRRQLVGLAAAEKTRLKQAATDQIAQSCRKMIEHLEAERAEIEMQIDARLQSSEEGRRRVELLQSIPGVGPLVASTLLVDMPELGALDRKAAASLAGVAPHVAQSGALKNQAVISGGRPCVRVALYLAALASARSKRGFKDDYWAMRDAGKPPKVALIAIARRIITAANAILKTGEPWRVSSQA